MGAFGCVAIRVVLIQFWPSAQLLQLARRQHELQVDIPALRGTIYDRHMRPLAMTVMADSVAANPRQMSTVTKASVTDTLAQTLHLEASFVTERLARDKSFVWLKRQVSPADTHQLRELNIPWVHLVKEAKRLYPAGSLASHLLGYVGVDHDGLEGLESLYNDTLAGIPGHRRLYRDGKGRLLYHHLVAYEPPTDGQQVVLTIDAGIQAIAEEALDEAYRKTQAVGGSVIVMNPKTGEVLALANRPHYEAGALDRTSPDARRNRAVTDVMEPGSVFKAMMAGALLDAGLVTPEEEFFCEQGQFRTVGHHILHDHRPHGGLTFRDVIVHSSNIGVAKATQRLDPERLDRYIRLFGFGAPTGIDLPGEVAGLVRPPAQWSKLSPYVIPIGQEIGVTVIQIAAAISTIANDGILLKPYVVQAIHARDGTRLQTFEPDVKRRVITSAAATMTREILAGVVQTGSGRAAHVKGFRAGGKTGTAQKLEPDGRYSHSKFIATFAGFVPIEDPVLVIVVTLDEPRTAYYGGVVAAPVFRRIAEATLQYLGIQPSVGLPDMQLVGT